MTYFFFFFFFSKFGGPCSKLSQATYDPWAVGGMMGAPFLQIIPTARTPSRQHRPRRMQTEGNLTHRVDALLAQALNGSGCQKKIFFRVLFDVPVRPICTDARQEAACVFMSRLKATGICGALIGRLRVWGRHEGEVRLEHVD